MTDGQISVDFILLGHGNERIVTTGHFLVFGPAKQKRFHQQLKSVDGVLM